MEELSLGKKITRFGHCNPGFYPPIEKVLMRLPEEICSQVILDDLSFEIVSFNNDSVGQYYQFASQIKSLVVLNESILNLPESEIIDAVGHEIAQKITKKVETGLNEKESGELLMKRGFEKEVNQTKYGRQILGGEGYQIGYKWAGEQKDLSKFEEFYDKWNESRLSGERLEELLYIADPFSILYEMGFFEGKDVNLVDEGDFFQIPKDATFDNGSLNKGIVWGLMGFLKEKKRKMKEKIF